ncbi:hypothetical protein M0812_23477 [Anaeramoeba flamelloides]|uniref:BTB domain-containing protein n=1 Tax=Anaeramoeba flamelloides TaxID=1746091 RepID=A0AAV7YLV1_9EUKA|nr:hypothetical protein M0812_23477 [Anaeramoeba flamelloides]
MSDFYYCFGNNHQGESNEKSTENKVAQQTKVTPFPNRVINSTVAGYTYRAIQYDDEIKTYYLKKEYSIKKMVQKICPGFEHFCFLTVDGEVYGFGKNSYGQLTNSFVSSSEFVQLKLENNEVFIDCAAGYNQTYCVTKDLKLYVCGYPNNGALGTGNENRVDNLLFLRDNVTNVYCGTDAEGLIFKTQDNKYFGFGKNESGNLGIGSKTNQTVPHEITFLNSKSIISLCLGLDHTLVLIEINGKNKVYSAGKALCNGFGQEKTSFTELDAFGGEEVIDISTGCNHCLAITDTNKFYGWGENTYYQITTSGSTIRTPQQINIKDLDLSLEYKLSCGSYNSLFYVKGMDSLGEDFLKLLEDQEYTDSEIGNLKVHKSFVELRSGKSLKNLKEILENDFDNEKISLFLKWVYSGSSNYVPKISEIFEKLDIDHRKKTISCDMKSLFNDENGKNYKILVPEEIEDEDEDSGNEGMEDDNLEEIPVHKFVLAARSGLFRNMFKNVTEETQSVRDYSGKAIESIEFLIKYLYTGKIELTADDDPQLIVEDLEDVVEYYQLNPKIRIKNQLKKIRMQFGFD